MKTTHLMALGVLSLAFALPAAAHNVVYTAELLSGPGIELSPATGFAKVTLDLDELTMHVQASFSGLVAPSTASHIHCCTATSNAGTAPVAVGFADFPTGVTSGTYDKTFDVSLLSTWNSGFVTRSGGTVDGALAAFQLAMGSGKAYFNVHSSAFPAGELHGNFIAAAVPEPHTGLMLLMGLAGVGAVVQRRRAN